MKLKKHLLALSCSILLGCCTSVFGGDHVLTGSSESVVTLRQLERFMSIVEKKVTKDDLLSGYEKVFYGVTLDKELGLGLKLYRDVKDKNEYSIIITYSDSCFTFATDRTGDKMYFTQAHWAGESLKDVVEHFNNGEIQQDRYIRNKARYFSFNSENGTHFYVGVPFIEGEKSKLLIYGIQEENDEGVKKFVGYGNGEVSLQQTENLHNQ